MSQYMALYYLFVFDFLWPDGVGQYGGQSVASNCGSI